MHDILLAEIQRSSATWTAVSELLPTRSRASLTAPPGPQYKQEFAKHNSYALLRGMKVGAGQHLYIVTPYDRLVDSVASEHLQAVAHDPTELIANFVQLATESWERMIQGGTGRRYIGRPEDLQFGKEVAALEKLPSCKLLFNNLVERG